MGTYSVASYLFEMDLHNPSRVASYSEWYAANLPPQMSENLAKQTQLDVDLFAQMIVKRFGPKQGEEDGNIINILNL
uniref:Uncharacterized protein n=1 Tax=Romanomermis culicivorax TaxID=13658 RepID=A0A915IPA6_ROMCU